MAVTDQGRALTTANYEAQRGIAAQAERDLQSLMRLIDPHRLDATFPEFLRALEAVANMRKGQSASVGAAYFRAFREAEIGGAFPGGLVADRIDSEAFARSMLYEGPVTIKRKVGAGVPLDEALGTATSNMAGALTTAVLAGGREAVLSGITQDEECRGVARVTHGRPCGFCAMLASRGPVYRSESTASFQPHKRCHCTVEPVYPGDYTWPGDGAKYRAMWSSLKGTGHANANGMRRLLAGQAV